MLFSQYVNFYLCYCCQNSNQSTMNKTCHSRLRLMPLLSRGYQSLLYASRLIIHVPNFQKETTFLQWYGFCCLINQWLSNECFLTLSPQILFNLCSVTGLRAGLHCELQMKQVSICILLLGMQYDLWNIVCTQHSVGNVFSHLKANLENKQCVIATYFYLRDWKQIFIGNTLLISIEMNMMTDNEYMPLNASQPSQNDQV